MSSSEQLPRADRDEEILGVVLEFIEIAVHQVLYIRQVYPPALFERRRKYDMSIRISRYPELNKYITDVLASGRGFFRRGEVEKVVVLLTRSSDQLPLERFVLDFMESWDLPALCSALQRDDPFLEELEEGFRSLLLRIGTADALLPPIPDAQTGGCAFQILLYTKEEVKSQGRENAANSTSNLCDYHEMAAAAAAKAGQTAKGAASSGRPGESNVSALRQAASERVREREEWVIMSRSEVEPEAPGNSGRVQPLGEMPVPSAESAAEAALPERKRAMKITPLKSMTDGPLTVQLYVER